MDAVAPGGTDATETEPWPRLRKEMSPTTSATKTMAAATPPPIIRRAGVKKGGRGADGSGGAGGGKYGVVGGDASTIVRSRDGGVVARTGLVVVTVVVRRLSIWASSTTEPGRRPGSFSRHDATTRSQTSGIGLPCRSNSSRRSAMRGGVMVSNWCWMLPE